MDEGPEPRFVGRLTPPGANLLDTFNVEEVGLVKVASRFSMPVSMLTALITASTEDLVTSLNNLYQKFMRRNVSEGIHYPI